MESQTISINLRAKDHMLINQSAERIIKLAEKNGVTVSRPISLPMMMTHKRSIDIVSPTSRMVDELMSLELPDSVDVDIKFK